LQAAASPPVGRPFRPSWIVGATRVSGSSPWLRAYIVLVCCVAALLFVSSLRDLSASQPSDVVAAHGGRLWVEDVAGPGSGARFAFTLPTA
jgi:hypothetical protein